MQKIGFNEHYGLQTAVYNGTKTNTRRIEKCLDQLYAAEKQLGKPLEIYQQEITREGIVLRTNAGIISLHTRYKIDDEVAVAQAYKDCGYNPDMLQLTFVNKPTVFPDLDSEPLFGWIELPLKYHKGWSNKMFTLPDLMPHQICITGIKVERMQDITEDDARREGVEWCHGSQAFYVNYNRENGSRVWLNGNNVIEAFAILIDKVSGRGTWERNPWVFAYTFELVK